MKIGLVGISYPGWVTLSLYYLYANVLPIIGKNKIEVIEYSTKSRVYEIIKELKQKKFDIICFSMYVWNEKKISLITSHLKKGKKKPLIIVGGPSTGDAKRILKKYPKIDVVIRGEGETTFKEIVKGRGQFHNLLGVSYRKGGKIINNLPRPVMKSLDNIKSPFRKNINFPFKKKYMYDFSRGCNHRCAYCVIPTQGKLKSFSLKRAKEDLSNIIKNSNKKWITLSDAYINVSNAFLKNFLDQVINKLPKFNMVVEIDTNTLDEEGVRLLKLLNVRTVGLGLQTTSKTCLKVIKRHFNERRFNTALKVLKKQDMLISCSIILGLPGDTLESFKASLDYLVSKIKPHIITVFKLQVLPGTEIYNLANSLDLKYNHTPPFKVISSKTFSKKDIEKAEKYIKEATKKNLGKIKMQLR